MLLEALVITACLEQKGCSESTSAYYQHNKELQVMVEKVEEMGKKLVNGNEFVIYAVTPVYAIASGRTANFHVYRGFVLGINVKSETVLFQWSY